MAIARSPEQVAWTFHQTLLEVLRRLNQAAERHGEIEGLEYPELERAMSRFWAVDGDAAELGRAVELLRENGLVAIEDEPKYAWDRRRVLGDRYRVTSLGKAYLLRQISETERIR